MLNQCVYLLIKDGIGSERGPYEMELPIVIWSHKKNDPLLKILIEQWKQYAAAIGSDLIVVTNSTHDFDVETIRYAQSNWREEWLEAIDFLHARGYSSIVSILDDFYFLGGPSKDQIAEIKSYINQNNIDYFALEPNPTHWNLVSSMWVRGQKYITYSGSECYPSSLRPSVWRLTLLKKSLQRVNDIWSFEHQFFSQYKYAMVTQKDSSIRVRHLLEKGRLNSNSLLINPLKLIMLMRVFECDWMSILLVPKRLLSKVILRVFGYRVHLLFGRIR